MPTVGPIHFGCNGHVCIIPDCTPKHPNPIPDYAVCRTRVTTNSVNMTYARHESPSSQSVRPVNGWSWVRFLSGTQTFSLSHARDMLNIPSFLISSPSLKFTIFLYLSPIGHFDIADPSSMQDACHHELS